MSSLGRDREQEDNNRNKYDIRLRVQRNTKRDYQQTPKLSAVWKGHVAVYRVHHITPIPTRTQRRHLVSRKTEQDRTRRTQANSTATTTLGLVLGPDREGGGWFSFLWGGDLGRALGPDREGEGGGRRGGEGRGAEGEGRGEEWRGRVRSGGRACC